MAALSSVIVDSGASVCISPHRSEFVTYNESRMKIKDLSSSNQVAQEKGLSVGTWKIVWEIR
jgi:hypothetical protein